MYGNQDPATFVAISDHVRISDNDQMGWTQDKWAIYEEIDGLWTAVETGLSEAKARHHAQWYVEHPTAMKSHLRVTHVVGSNTRYDVLLGRGHPSAAWPAESIFETDHYIDALTFMQKYGTDRGIPIMEPDRSFWAETGREREARDAELDRRSR